MVHLCIVKKHSLLLTASRYFKQEVKLIYLKYNIFHFKYWLVLLWLGCRLVLLLWIVYACADPLCYNAATGFLAVRQEVGVGCSLH